MLALLLTLCMVLALPVGAAAGSMYLALGDSISKGTDLENVETERFPALVAAELGDDYELVNLAEDGETTTSLLEKLATEDYQTAVASADIITLTIGGNDLMEILYR